MRSLFCTILFLLPALYAAPIDPSLSSFELRERKHVDVYDFDGEYEKLENIDIDARRKQRVEVLLTGIFPTLKTVDYQGTFGNLIGKLSGNFPHLSTVNFLCKSAMMQFDFSGKWQKNCEITIRGTTGDIVLTLPKDVGIIVNTKKMPTGKVVVNDLKKKGMGWMAKTYVNEQLETSPVTLTFNVEVTTGRIVIN